MLIKMQKVGVPFKAKALFFLTLYFHSPSGWYRFNTSLQGLTLISTVHIFLHSPFSFLFFFPYVRGVTITCINGKKISQS